jgi:hypothetical protein
MTQLHAAVAEGIVVLIFHPNPNHTNNAHDNTQQRPANTTAQSIVVADAVVGET